VGGYPGPALPGLGAAPRFERDGPGRGVVPRRAQRQRHGGGQRLRRLWAAAARGRRAQAGSNRESQRPGYAPALHGHGPGPARAKRRRPAPGRAGPARHHQAHPARRPAHRPAERPGHGPGRASR
jgi:hypothetical protein